MFRVGGPWDLARACRHHPTAWAALSAYLWIIPCWAGSPASCKVFFEVYYFLVHILDAPHWLVWDLMRGQKVKEKRVSAPITNGARLQETRVFI